METMCTYEDVREEFEDMGEDLINDLTGMTITLFKNVHDGSTELIVEIFGREGSNAVAILSRTLCNPEDYLKKRRNPHTVNLQDLLGVIDDDLIGLLLEKKVPIIVNPGWETEQVVYLDNPNQSVRIEREEQ